MKSNWVSDDGALVSRRVFTDEQIYRQEQTSVFGRNWLYLAHESELRKKGDFITTYMGETSVILTRGKNDTLHAVVNSCTHRGLPVCLADRGNARLFTCPYHAWTFAPDGALLGIPQQELVTHRPDKSSLGLKSIPRIETYRGLIFGSLDPEIEPLESHLGDMRFYLDAYFDNFPDGVEVLGVPSKWRLACNWKLPAENQLGDHGHTPFLHGWVSRGTRNLENLKRYGINIAPKPGHGAAIILKPEEGGDELVSYSPETTAYLADLKRRAESSLGSLRSRIAGMTYTIFPNFSLLWAVGSVRVAHPRGPGQTDLWSWWIGPAGAPDSVRRELQQGYLSTFGPGGAIEQDDSDAWSLQYVGSRSEYMDDRPYYYGLGLGDEQTRTDIPGLCGSAFNEHCARQFYQRWQQDMRNEESSR